MTLPPRTHEPRRGSPGGSPAGHRPAGDAPSAEALRARQRLYLMTFAVFAAILLSVAHLGFFLYLVFVSGGLLLVSWLLAAAGIEGVKVSRIVSGDRVEIGQTLEVALTIQNDKPGPVPWLFWEDQLEGDLVAQGPSCSLAGFKAREIRDLVYQVTFPRRGLFRLGPALLEASGPFGLIRRYHVGQDAAFVTVLPRVVPLRRLWPPNQSPVHQVPRRRGLFEDPARTLGTRAYQPSDGARRVHWRATARAGRLLSRVYEPTVLGGVLLALDLHLEAFQSGTSGRMRPRSLEALEGHPALELLLTTAASVAEHILAGGQKVGLFSNGGDAAERYPAEWSDDVFAGLAPEQGGAAPRWDVQRRRPLEVPPDKGMWQRDLLLTALARAIPTDGLTLGALLAAELPRLPRNLAMMIATPHPDEALARAMGMCQRAGLDVSVIWVTAGETGNPEEAGNPGDAGNPGNVGNPGDAGNPRGILPDGVVLHRVHSERSLAALGAVRL